MPACPRTAAAAAFHTSGLRAVLSITGGGTGLIPTLLTVPGGSASVLEAVVPYSPGSLHEWLGAEPEVACSAETALAMAARSFERCRLLGGGDQSVGLGMTAALVSSRPRRGDNRVHVAVQSVSGTLLESVRLAKGTRTRLEEESVCVDVGLSLLAEAAGGTHAVTLREDDLIRRRSEVADPAVAVLRGGDCERVWWIESAGGFTAKGPEGFGLLSGSFNPPHEGHERLRLAAEDWLAGPVYYELPVRNADKPPLDDIRLRSRLRELGSPVVLTAADTFVRKACIFPGQTFVIGVDTAVRVLDPRYYAGGIAEAMSVVRQAGCRFLVAARLSDEGVLRLRDCRVPPAVADLFDELPAELFREDISSTELRRRGQREGW